MGVAAFSAQAARVGRRFDELGGDGAPVRLGIMGGTFDPIHVGHLAVADEMSEALELDAVLFIPTGNPVFKREQKIADAAFRLEMCRLAVADNERFDVSSIEVDRKGDTFTVDTLRELRAQYPDNVEFYFIVGSDAAATIGKWRGVAELAKLTHLAVAVGRPGSFGADELRRIIADAADFDAHLVNITSMEVSSSGLRERMALGRSCRYLVPEAVWDFICEKGLYGPVGRVARHEDDALSKEFYKARKRELKERVSGRRYEHIKGVAKSCVMLARLYDVDERKARLAGLLHDWDKGMDDEQARERVRELGMVEELGPWVVEHMPRVLHGFTAARALGREFPSIPADVLQAIARHTTAAEDMSPLDMVLYIADAIEPSRQFGRIDELRAAVGKVSLEELYYQTYEYWVFLLFERRQPLHPDTIRIWNSYAEKRAQGKRRS